MGQDSGTEKTWKTILADHVGKAVATVIVAAGTAYLGLQFQSQNKPGTTEAPSHQVPAGGDSTDTKAGGTLPDRSLFTLKTATIVEAAKRISPRLTRLKTRSESDGEVTIVLENLEVDFTSLKVGKKVSAAGEFRAGGPRREPALFITKNNTSSFFKIVD